MKLGTFGTVALTVGGLTAAYAASAQSGAGSGNLNLPTGGNVQFFGAGDPNVRKATAIVNGDVIDAKSARAALDQSGADAIMIGRGGYGRPWLAAAIDRALQTGDAIAEPDLASRLDIVLDHLADSVRFYGDALGLKVFRKHLGWYVQSAPWPIGALARRTAKSTLCRLDRSSDVEAALIALWRGDDRLERERGSLDHASGATRSL